MVLPLLGVSLALVLTACFDAGIREHVPAPEREYGPPPASAPHGTRYLLADGTEVVYQQRLSAYAVLGISDTYYDGGWFFRRRDDAWYVAPAVDGPWKLLRGPLPEGLGTLGPQ